MKVLVINGSPRAKGNSDLLCDEFIRGGQERQDIKWRKSLCGRKTLVPAKPVMPVSKLVVVYNKTIWRTCWKR